jgi:hypothetical protein
MIQVFDTLGREVLVPVNDTFEAGYHAETADMTNLRSGTYIARFQNGEHQEVIRILKN